MLELHNIVVKYEENVALKKVSMKIEQGEIVALLGSNGAGKSTTLRAISGIVRPVSGEVTLKGTAIQRWAPNRIVRAGISQCPEGRQLWPDMTVMENLEMGAFIRKDKAAIARDMERVINMFPIIGQRKGQLAGSLSGGEQQALAIARAMMADPEIILFDEPSLGLAPMLVSGIMETIVTLREAGLTVLLVEQNAFAALKVADRGYVLEKGEVSLHGTSEELLNNDEIRRVYLGI